MLSETLVAGLEHYKIGPKIRNLRVKKNMGQVQLAEHTGLSPALLSKIERGQLFPTLPTLLRIAMVFGVGLEHFFIESKERPAVAVTRKQERVRLPDRPGEAAPSYLFESLNFRATNRKMDAYFAEFPKSAQPSQPHQHAGTEFIYLIEGRLIVNIDGDDTALAGGDSMQFDSGTPHSYRRQGQAAAAAIIIVMG
ncbi:MAG: cupin domain-containing protein [Acetobacteraceae bacterium]|nr:cupin domain-containing protein [Acetobacteraceae bacterium]MBV8526064.1 cupin domain-containing protein [Acetobacteraceae bacterium]MBV8588613.1 cupin domain-containing protein [Acetobacteraceae bacterium]